jgi:hypothetical protein
MSISRKQIISPSYISGRIMRVDSNGILVNSLLFDDELGLGIGTTTPNGVALLDIVSSEKGVMLPRMTTAQRNAITVGASTASLLIYNTSTNQYNYYDGSAWQSFGGFGGTLTTDFIPKANSSTSLGDSVIKQLSSTEIQFGQSGTDMFISSGVSSNIIEWDKAGNNNVMYLRGNSASPNDIFFAVLYNSVANQKQFYFTPSTGVSKFSFEYDGTDSEIEFQNSGTGLFSIDWEVISFGNTTQFFHIEQDSVKIGGTPPADTSALVDISSTTQGFLVPRMTTAQKNAIGTPATSLLVFDTTLNTYNFYDGVSWVSLGGGSGWSLSGNTLTGGVTTPNEFLGSTSNHDLIFRSNNIEHLRVSTGGTTTLTNSAGAGSETLILEEGSNPYMMFKTGATDRWELGRDTGGFYINGQPSTATEIALRISEGSNPKIRLADAVNSTDTSVAVRLRSYGNTSSTFSFKSENNNGDPILLVRDDNRVGINQVGASISATLHVLSESGDSPLRIDTNSTNNMLFVDGVNDAVGINTSSVSSVVGTFGSAALDQYRFELFRGTYGAGMFINNGLFTVKGSNATLKDYGFHSTIEAFSNGSDGGFSSLSNKTGTGDGAVSTALMCAALNSANNQRFQWHLGGAWISDTAGSETAYLKFNVTGSGVGGGGSANEVARLTGESNFGLNVMTFGTNASGVFALKNGGEPTTSPTDTIQIFSKDSSDSLSTLGLRLEQAVEAIGTFTASHKIKVWLNGVEYWLQLDAV